MTGGAALVTGPGCVSPLLEAVAGACIGGASPTPRMDGVIPRAPGVYCNATVAPLGVITASSKKSVRGGRGACPRRPIALGP